MKPVYEKYAAIRDARGMSDHQVAQAVGFGASTLYDWKAGRYLPKLDKISALANLLGVKLEDLLAA